MSQVNSSASEKLGFTPEVDSKFKQHKNYFFIKKLGFIQKENV